MPLFEVETTSHIMIACADDEQTARSFAATNYPAEEIIRVVHRPRDAWVISKKLLGIQGIPTLATSPGTVWPRRPATSCTPCGCTCRPREPTWTARARPSRRTCREGGRPSPKRSHARCGSARAGRPAAHRRLADTRL